MSLSSLHKSVKSITTQWKLSYSGTAKLSVWLKANLLAKSLKKATQEMLLWPKTIKTMNKIQINRNKKTNCKSLKKTMNSMFIVSSLCSHPTPKSLKKLKNKPLILLKRTNQPCKRIITNWGRFSQPQSHAAFYWAPVFPTCHLSSYATPMKSLLQIYIN